MWVGFFNEGWLGNDDHGRPLEKHDRVQNYIVIEQEKVLYNF